MIPKRMDGVLNVYKPAGPTSHDVVARARRILGQRRIGHSGTLDPMADGVLLLCVGRATRLVEYLNDLEKRYRATARFGIATDTQDCTGAVQQERPAGHLTPEAVEKACAAFRGEIRQRPPMFSALKLGGRPLYERARRGEVVDRELRTVTLHRLEVLDFRGGDRPEADLDVLCSSGTYVRTLCHDLGAALGTGAAMSALTRTAIGPHGVCAAISLEMLEEASLADSMLPWISPSDAVAHLPAVSLDPRQVSDLARGRRIPLESVVTSSPFRALDREGALVAIARLDRSDGPVAAPVKVFADGID